MTEPDNRWTAHGGCVVFNGNRRVKIEMPVGVNDGIEDCHERARRVAAALNGSTTTCPYVVTSDEGTSYCCLAEHR